LAAAQAAASVAQIVTTPFVQITPPVIPKDSSGNYIPYGSPGSVKPGDKGFIGPVAVKPASTGTVDTTTLAGIMKASGITVNNTFNSNGIQSPQAISDTIMSGIKYGTVVAATSNFTYNSGNPNSNTYVAPQSVSAGIRSKLAD
jgi:hypothetical protein